MNLKSQIPRFSTVRDCRYNVIVRAGAAWHSLKSYMLRFVVLAVAIAIAFARSVSGDEDVGGVGPNRTCTRCRKNCAMPVCTSAKWTVRKVANWPQPSAVTRFAMDYPITGQLDEETSKALGTNPAVTTTPAIARRAPRHGEGCAPVSGKRLTMRGSRHRLASNHRRRA
jgi:hypothetical protein